jgi:N-carbamoylputrescine amidase
MSEVKLAATQMACSWDRAENLEKAETLVRDAAARGARIIQLQELFETPYFCQQQEREYFELATPIDENPAVRHFQGVAWELEVVLPISFFERAKNVYFNSVAVIDANGEMMGTYRKTHIPDSPGYCEKYYFSPGDTGPRVWRTRYATIGVGICWDQWFPELARAMALMGAEIVLYPSAIGSVPGAEDFDICPQWQRSMQGHSASNLMAVVASNRVGVEQIDGSEITWFGSSFITDGQGQKIAEAGRESEEVIVAEVNLDLIRMLRDGFLFFRDRRPEMYGPLLRMTG